MKNSASQLESASSSPAWWPAIPLLVCSVVFIMVEDLNVGGWMKSLSRTAKPMSDLLPIGEQYPSTWGLILIPAGIYLLDPMRRSNALRVLWAVGWASLVNGLLKLLFNRQRPPFDRRNGYAPTAEADDGLTWFVWSKEGDHDFMDGDFQSYPSGHTTVAVLLALVLTRFYPRGWPIWWLLAFATMAQRFLGAQHYPSDILASAAVALVVFAITERNSTLVRAREYLCRFLPDAPSQ